MRAFRQISDKLVNLVAGLGTPRDKATGSTYAAPVLDDAQLVNAYRGAWLPRKIIDIPAQDSTRKWREWYAGSNEIEVLEAEEIRLGLRAKVREVLTKARLFGGAAIFIGTGESDPSKPLALDRIGKGGVKYLAVMSRLELHAGDIENDVLSPGYGKPKYYRAGNVANIHPSRLAIFMGAPLPDVTFSGVMHGWGDSVLTAIFDAIQQSDSTMANMASLVFEAKVDVFRLPDFMEQVNSPQYRTQVLERLQLAAIGKGVNGVLLMDKEEEYESKTHSFGGLPDVVDRFLQAVAGAADIPATRLLGQAPQGMSSTGEGDLKNYYDRVQSMQELDIGPALNTLDEALIRSATGKRDPSIYYEWCSLWQTTPKENADIGKTVADTLKVLSDTKLLPSDVLSKAAETTLIERNVLPGLESALVEYGTESPEPPEPVAMGDAAPRTLYVSRSVTNVAEIAAWAKSQGLPALDDNLHTTIALSKTPVDWMKVGNGWNGAELTVAAGGARLVEPIGKAAAALLFTSGDLAWRNMQIREAGASWDYPDYQPHVTLIFEGVVDLSKVEPYRGEIKFGPEIFEEVKD